MCLHAVLNQHPIAAKHKYSMFKELNMAKAYLSIYNKAKYDTSPLSIFVS